MSKISERKIVSILQILNDHSQPVGSSLISLKLQELGHDLSERTIRYYLQKMDQDGLTKNLGKKGRIVTEKGINELNSAFTFEKVGFIASKIDTLTYQMNFSIQKLSGRIILNHTTLPLENFKEAYSEIKSVFDKGLGMGKYVTVNYEENTPLDLKSSPGKVTIGTVCSVTINGIFFNKGIYTTSRFGGVLEISKGEPLRFIDIINYDGTSIDPLEIFIKGRMTSVRDVVNTGNGRIGAGFREFPSIALNKALKIKKRMSEIGLDGILMIGKPGQSLLGIPVSEGRVGMIVAGGLNPIAAVEEMGIPTENTALKSLHDFNKMIRYNELFI
ncbi:MAG: NrpR regulatory domain-containing protein [Spirochaetota bacterium]